MKALVFALVLTLTLALTAAQVAAECFSFWDGKRLVQCCVMNGNVTYCR